MIINHFTRFFMLLKMFTLLSILSKSKALKQL